MLQTGSIETLNLSLMGGDDVVETTLLAPTTQHVDGGPQLDQLEVQAVTCDRA